MSNEIVCQRRCNQSQRFYAMHGPGSTPQRPFMMLRNEWSEGKQEDNGFKIETDIPEAEELAFWSDRDHTARVRARVTYQGNFYCYLLEDHIGWPWIEVNQLKLVNR